MFIKDAFAMAPPPGAEVGPVDTVMSFLPLVFLILIFYFFLIRPQQKRQREMKEMIDNLREGDRVMTQGGLYGIIAKIKDNELTLEIAPDVKVKVDRHYVAEVGTKDSTNE